MGDRTIGEVLGIERSEYRAVVAPMMAYLFGLITQHQLFSYLEATYERHEIRAFIDAVQESGYILKNCKLFTYAKYHEPKTKATDYDVHPVDARFLSTLNLEQVGKPIPVLSLETYNAMEVEVFTSADMKEYIGKFINAKLRFLEAWGLSFDDLFGQLVAKGLYALLRQFPNYKGPSHFVNIAKNTIKNTGKTMITTYTRQKRKALMEGHTGRHISIFDDIELHIELQAPNDRDLMDNLQSLQQISTRFGPRVTQFMNCMSGQHDPGFSEYLKADNVDEIERLPYEKYRSKLERYMGLTSEQTENLMRRIREHL